MKKKIYLFITLIIMYLSGLTAAYGSDSLFLSLADSIDIIIAPNGSGDYEKVQDAINAIPDNNPERLIIYIRNGNYKEKILIPAIKTNITLVGQSVDSTILTYDDYNGRVVEGDTLGTSDSYSFAVEADDFTAMNLTIENSAGDVGQAVALRSRGDRQLFLHCRFSGYQDTYYTYGRERNYLKDCQIIGAIDYIFGSTTVIFDSCQIHSLRENSYITAARTPEGVGFGYVFFDCRLTASYAKTGVFLGRPWRPYAQTVFFECEEGAFIDPAGWSIWNGNENHLTCFYAEYHCFGAGSDTTNRVSWSHQLTDEEALEYAIENIFAESVSTEFNSNWLPDFEDDFIYHCIKEYTVKFMDSVNFNSHVKSILYDGVELYNFSPDSFNYYIELPEGTTEIPELEVEMEDSLATYDVRYPGILPNMSTVVGTARDRGTHSVYSVYLSVDSAYCNARLRTLRYNGVSVSDFDPYRYDYTVVLSPGTTSVPTIVAYTEISQATRVITRPESVPGTATVVVTAVNKSTTQTYTIEFTVATGISDSKVVGGDFIISNPFDDAVHFFYNNFTENNIIFSLFDMKGTLVIKKVLSTSGSENEVIIDTHNIKSGDYFYTVELNDELQSGKIVKLH